MKIDTHTHLLLTKNALPDWKAINYYYDVAKASGLDVVCMTEHLDAIYYPELLESIFRKNVLNGKMLADSVIKLPNSLILLSGAEVSLKGGADVGLHTNVNVLKKLNNEKGYYTLETLTEAVSRLTDDYILAGHHLYRPGKWIDNFEENNSLLTCIELPAKDIAQKEKYIALAEKFKKQVIAGSDAHTWVQLGVGKTFINSNAANTEYFDVSLLKKAISEKSVTPEIAPESEKIINISNLFRKYLTS